MKQKEILFIISSIFFLVFVWIGLSIYHRSVTSTITPSQNVEIAPIDPTFNTTELDRLKKRASVSPMYEVQNVTPSPVSTVTPLPSPTLQITPTIASQSASQSTGSAKTQ